MVPAGGGDTEAVPIHHAQAVVGHHDVVEMEIAVASDGGRLGAAVPVAALITDRL